MNEEEKILIVDDEESTCKTLLSIYKRKAMRLKWPGRGRKRSRKTRRTTVPFSTQQKNNKNNTIMN